MCQDELSMVKSRRHTKRAINEDRKHLFVGTMTFKWLNSKSFVPLAMLTSGTGIALGCLSFFFVNFLQDKTKHAKESLMVKGHVLTITLFKAIAGI